MKCVGISKLPVIYINKNHQTISQSQTKLFRESTLGGQRGTLTPGQKPVLSYFIWDFFVTTAMYFYNRQPKTASIGFGDRVRVKGLPID